MFSISQEIYVCHGMTSSLEGWGTEMVAFENWFWISLNNKENVTNILYLMETLEHDVFGKMEEEKFNISPEGTDFLFPLQIDRYQP